MYVLSMWKLKFFALLTFLALPKGRALKRTSFFGSTPYLESSGCRDVFSIQSDSLVQCSLICKNNASCSSFFFNQEKNICTGCQVSRDQGDTYHQKDTESRYFKELDKPDPNMAASHMTTALSTIYSPRTTKLSTKTTPTMQWTTNVHYSSVATQLSKTTPSPTTTRLSTTTQSITTKESPTTTQSSTTVQISTTTQLPSSTISTTTKQTFTVTKLPTTAVTTSFSTNRMSTTTPTSQLETACTEGFDRGLSPEKYQWVSCNNSIYVMLGPGNISFSELACLNQIVTGHKHLAWIETESEKDFLRMFMEEEETFGTLEAAYVGVSATSPDMHVYFPSGQWADIIVNTGTKITFPMCVAYTIYDEYIGVLCNKELPAICEIETVS